MKGTVLNLAFGCLAMHGQAQTVPNGGFEDWDLEWSSPYEWTWAEINTPCSPLNYLAVPSTESHSGYLSARLESAVCTGPGGARLQMGKVYSGYGGYYPPRDWAFECAARPAYLQFHYKFHPEGGDSAYVRIILFNYDSITPGLSTIERRDTIGFASGYMHQEVTSFTPYSLPIQYLSADTPAFMHIFFCTSKTLAEGNYGNTAPYEYAYPGTILWVDDVHMSSDDTGMEDEGILEARTVFPNPGRDMIRFNGLEADGSRTVRVFDARGVLVLEDLMPDPSAGFDVSGLCPGFYSIVLDSSREGSICVKWVKEQ